jgi:cytochrome c-type biogenesis protein
MDPHAQLGWVVAIVAGVFSFISPCILPLVPGYLSMISGLSVEQLEERHHRGHLARLLISCILFSAGFSVVFLLLGASAGVVGHWLRGRMAVVNVIFGLVVIVFGLVILNVVKLPFLYQDRRFRVQRASVGIWAAPLLGLAFGFGWTPCVGPFLAALYTIAANLSPAQSAALFGIYSATLGLCFVVAGMLLAYALKTFSFLQRHYRAIEVISGGLLIIIGLLLVSQQWDRASSLLMRPFG